MPGKNSPQQPPNGLLRTAFCVYCVFFFPVRESSFQQGRILLKGGNLLADRLRHADGLVLLVVESHHDGLALALDGLGADVQGALAKGEALVAQTGDGGLDNNLVWIKDGGQEVGAHIGHHDAHLLEHVIANDIQEVFCLAHVEQREIDRIVDMAERIYIRKAQLRGHLMLPGEI